jgi:membrane-bound metal-dependent hydrolase YbcI (DUF457 family)
MATVGHLAVGAAIGRLFADPKERATKTVARMAVAACIATAPDLDLVLRLVGIGAGDGPAAHRGGSHSLAMGAFLAGAMAMTDASRRDICCYGLALSSHGVTDLLSSRERGIALLWPFSPRRLTVPWHPVPGVLTKETLEAGRFVPNLIRESLFFAPFALVALWPRKRRSRGHL